MAFIVDITDPGNKGIYSNFSTRIPATIPQVIRNDQEQLSFRFVKPSAGNVRPWDDVDYSAAATTCAIGGFDLVPTAGTNTFQAGPKTTGTFSNASTTVTVASGTNISNGMKVSGAGIAAGTTCTISGTAVTLSQNTTAAGSGVVLFFYQETAGVATGASAATVSTAVNGLAVVSGNGGVTVTNPEAGVYMFVLGNTGATAFYLSGSPAGLSPASSLVSSEVLVGATGVASEQVVEIFQNPYAVNSTWTAFPSASSSVNQTQTGANYSYTGTNVAGAATITGLSGTSGLVVGMLVYGTGIATSTTIAGISGTTVTLSSVTTAGTTGGTYIFTNPSIFSLVITPGAYDGYITLSTPLITTQSIPVTLTGLSASAIQLALNNLGANYTVSGNLGGPFVVSDPTGNNTLPTCNTNNLIVPKGLTGSLITNTFGMLQAFIAAGNATSIAGVFEVQVFPTGQGQTTPLQFPVTVQKNVINLSTLIPTPSVNYMTTAQATALFDQKNYGSVNLGSGVSTYTVTGQSFPSTPSYILCWIDDSGDGPVMFARVDNGSITTGGFTAYFSGQTTTTTARLCWKAFL